MKKNTNRRSFLKKASLAGFAGLLNTPIVFAEQLQASGILPVFIEQEDHPFNHGKHPDMRIVNDAPLNMEAPAHLLDDAITPADKMFVRNNGTPPQLKNINPQTWTLSIGGESVIKPKTYTLAQLQKQFKHYTYQLVLECGGNGRHEFNPPAKGNQWTQGAVSCAKWTGVRLKDILKDAGVKSDAVYIGYYGKDIHLSGKKDKVVISRGIPMHKAMEEETLIAWAMNGEDIPFQNGYPLRLVVGGWPASVSGKWLSKLVIRNKIHDGPKMGGQSYRIPCKPVAPGTKVDDKDMCIIESMPVKSLITYPKTGAIVSRDKTLEVRGHAWAGDFSVDEMHISIDFGATWQKCTLKKAVNRLAWQQWTARVQFPEKGYYEVWARAKDSQGKMQPMVVPNWNPRGYLNNACHRIAIKTV